MLALHHVLRRLHLARLVELLREVGDEGFCPLPEQRQVLHGAADLGGDDPQRQLHAELGEKLAVALVDEGIDELVGRLLDEGLQGLQAPGRERAVHELAVAALQGRVLGQHGVRDRVALGHRRRHLGVDGTIRPTGRQARHDAGKRLVIHGHVDHVLVAGDEPDAAVRVLVNGRLLAQTPVHGHRVGQVLRPHGPDGMDRAGFDGFG